eukprot:12687012-Alexandrium_andersonii.AAC.1
MAAGPVDPGASGGARQTRSECATSSWRALGRGARPTGVRSLDRAWRRLKAPKTRAEGPGDGLKAPKWAEGP